MLAKARLVEERLLHNLEPQQQNGGHEFIKTNTDVRPEGHIQHVQCLFKVKYLLEKQ